MIMLSPAALQYADGETRSPAAAAFTHHPLSAGAGYSMAILRIEVRGCGP